MGQELSKPTQQLKEKKPIREDTMLQLQRSETKEDKRRGRSKESRSTACRIETQKRNSMFWQLL